MVTRQEIQIALDLIKHVNVPNDLLLSAAAPIAKGELKVTEGGIGKQSQRGMTLAEKKANLATLSEEVRGYRQKCTSFLAVAAQRKSAENGLKALGMTVEDLEADIATLKTATDRMAQGAKVAKVDADMAAVAADLDRDTPALPLVRKA